jgi:hypothetical protein
MKVRSLMTVSGTDANHPGTKPQEEIPPSPIGSRLYQRASKTRAAVAPQSRVAYHQRHEGAAGDLRDRLLTGEGGNTKEPQSL